MGASNPTEEVDDEQEDAGDLFIWSLCLNQCQKHPPLLPQKNKKNEKYSMGVFGDEY